MKDDRSNGLGLVDRGPRIETTLDMSMSRLVSKYDLGARTPHRKLTSTERAWINSGSVYSDTSETVNDDTRGHNSDG